MNAVLSDFIVSSIYCLYIRNFTSVNSMPILEYHHNLISLKLYPFWVIWCLVYNFLPLFVSKKTWRLILVITLKLKKVTKFLFLVCYYCHTCHPSCMRAGCCFISFHFYVFRTSRYLFPLSWPYWNIAWRLKLILRDMIRAELHIIWTSLEPQVWFTL